MTETGPEIAMVLDSMGQKDVMPYGNRGLHLLNKLLATCLLVTLDKQLERVGKTWPMLSALAYLLGGDTATTKQEKREELYPCSAAMISHISNRSQH